MKMKTEKLKELCHMSKDLRDALVMYLDDIERLSKEKGLDIVTLLEHEGYDPDDIKKIILQCDDKIPKASPSKPTKQTKSEGKKKKKRPQSAYNAWIGHCASGEEKGGLEKPFKECVAEWKEMPPEEKAVFEEIAKGLSEDN